jgi:hypothetical protein
LRWSRGTFNNQVKADEHRPFGPLLAAYLSVAGHADWAKQVRVRDQVLIMCGFVAGLVLGGTVGWEALVALAPWWRSAKWLDVAWVQAAFLFCIFGGAMAAVEITGLLGHVAMPGSRARRVAFRGAFVAILACWFGVSRSAPWQRHPWGFWASMAGFFVLAVITAMVGMRLGVWPVKDGPAQTRSETGRTTTR